MKHFVAILLAAAFTFATLPHASSQEHRTRVRQATAARWEVDSKGDSTLHIRILQVNIYHRMRDIRNYQKMVKAVKKVYPLALEAARRMKSTDIDLA